MTEIVKLEDVAYVIDRTHITPKYAEDGVPLLSPASFTEFDVDLSKCKKIHEQQYQEEIKRCKPEVGDILFSRIGTIGEVRWAPKEKFIPLHSLVLIKPYKDKIEPAYLYYCLKSSMIQAQARRGIQSISVPDLGIKLIKDFKIPLPLRDIQIKIAAALELADNLRQKRREASQLTNSIILSVFLKMFGDGIPQNKIGDVAEFVSSGSTPLGGEKTYVAHGIVFIRSQNVLMNELKLDDVAHITQQTHNQMRRTWIKDGDVLLNITGASMGRVAFYRGPDDKANVNQHVCIIRLNKHKALPEYISHYLSSSNAQKQIWTIQTGASRQALNFEQVKSLNLYLPPLSEQQKFATIVRTTQTLRDKQNQSTIQIDELFHSLMHKAFRGELVAEVKRTL